MGVRILHDREQGIACLYCSSSDVVFGQIFYAEAGEDAGASAQAFLRWLDSYFPKISDLNSLGRMSWRHDPRELTDVGLERAYSAWLNLDARQHDADPQAQGSL